MRMYSNAYAQIKKYSLLAVSYENLRAFENTEKALTENNLVLL